LMQYYCKNYHKASKIRECENSRLLRGATPAPFCCAYSAAYLLLYYSGAETAVSKARLEAARLEALEACMCVVMSVGKRARGKQRLVKNR
jgi:hypothetical protein